MFQLHLQTLLICFNKHYDNTNLFHSKIRTYVLKKKEKQCIILYFSNLGQYPSYYLSIYLSILINLSIIDFNNLKLKKTHYLHNFSNCLQKNLLLVLYDLKIVRTNFKFYCVFNTERSKHSKKIILNQAILTSILT